MIYFAVSKKNGRRKVALKVQTSGCWSSVTWQQHTAEGASVLGTKRNAYQSDIIHHRHQGHEFHSFTFRVALRPVLWRLALVRVACHGRQSLTLPQLPLSLQWAHRDTGHCQAFQVQERYQGFARALIQI